jgi:acetyl esterase/lipase
MHAHPVAGNQQPRRLLALGLTALLLVPPSWRVAAGAVATNVTSAANEVDRDPPGPGRSSENDKRLREALKRFPAADANGDGVLTFEEVRALRQRQLAGNVNAAGKRAERADAAAPTNPPTFADVPYGPHARNVLDFWKANSATPAPVVVFIHGGGFQAGDKSQARKDPLLKRYLDAGISFAAINYRFRAQAPIQDILHDAARAIQFLRFRAADWNVDKRRIAAYGGSAGAGTALWLAARAELADPDNPDPVLRESSRLAAAGLFNTQATYDLLRWQEFLGPFRDEWLQSPNEIAEFYHFKTRADLETPEGKRVRAECDMLRWLSPDDPPIFAVTTQHGGPSRNRGQHLHHPDHVREIQKRCREVGVACVVRLADDGPLAGDPREEWLKFVKQQLGVAAGN